MCILTRSSVDSDGEGFREAVEKGKGTSSTDATDKPNDLPSILSQAKLWLDSANTDGEGNISLSDGDPVSDWMDLSGSNHHLSQSNSSLNPILISNVQNNNDIVKFNNFLNMSSFNDYYQTWLVSSLFKSHQWHNQLWLC